MMRLWLALMLLTSIPAWGASGFVHTRGTKLVAADGKELLLRGTNLGNWFEPEGYMFHFEKGPESTSEIEALTTELLGPDGADAFWHEYRDTYITEQDIQFLQQTGINSVRVPLHWKFFQADDAEGFKLLDRLIEWSRRAGIYVILDLHCAPAGQTGANIDDSLGYPWLYASPSAQQKTIETWQRIAKRYHNETIVLGYDLLNEPIANYGPEIERYNPDLEPLYRRITTAIRQVDPNHVIILGGAQWDSNFKVFGRPFDPNVMYTFHKYWTDPTKAVIQEYLDFRTLYNVPIWCGESGENKDGWIEQFVKMLEANDVGWAFWPYKKMDSTSSFVTFARPAHWDEIVRFAALPTGTDHAKERIAVRPSDRDIHEAFDDLLRTIRFAQKRINSGYLEALGLRVPAQ